MQHRLVVRRVVVAHPAGLVTDADLDLVETVEDVEFGERDLGERVQPRRLAGHDGVEPADASTATGVGPELVPALDERLPDLAVDFRGEGTGAHARDVGLGDADDRRDVARPEAGAGAGAAGDGVGGGHERIGAVVEVEEGRLGALEQDPLAAIERVVHDGDGVADHRRQPGCELIEVLLGDRRRLDGGTVVDLGEDEVLLVQHHVEFLAKDLGVQEVLHAKSDARGLVGVGGADAALGRAQRVLAEEALGEAVQFLVVGHYQVRVARDDEPRDVDVLRAQGVQFGEQHGGVDHDAVADDRRDRGVQHARGYELQREGLAVDDDPVTGVVATLVAHRHIHVTRHEVGQLPFTFVTPLGSDDHRCGHWAPPSRPRCEQSLVD